jgi:predicted transcriptional regulator
MAQTLLEMAKDLTRTLVESGRLSAEDLQHTLQSTYSTLAALKAQEEAGTSPSMPGAEPPPVDWRKSITRHAVTCLVCGDTFKQLSIRHLSMHGLDTRSYRTQYGIPRTQPLSARSTTQRRRQVAQTLRPWERTSTYRKAQARHGTASPEPEAETLPEATEAPHTAASAQPKRQRKTTSRKNASPQDERARLGKG